MIFGINQKRLSIQERIVKVRSFPGATINDMYDYIKPLLKKAPANVILHVGTNDAPNSKSTAILDNMLSLKSFIEKTLPQSKVCISNLVKRTVNGKSTLTVNKVNEHLSALKLDIVDNSNINATHLNRGGLHLNETGTGKLAINFIKKIKSFKRRCQVTDSSSNKYFDFCPNSTIYSLGKQRIENLEKTRSEQQKSSSACDLSHEVDFDKLDVARSQNPDRILIAHLNNNSLRNKFVILKEIITNKCDILLISETKLDSSFPLNQFHIDGFTTSYRLDRNQNDGGIILYIREDIPSKSLTEIKYDNEIQNIFIEINLRSKKWLISGSYNPKLSHIKNHLQEIGKGLQY